MRKPYLALDTDSPERWDAFATQHPEYKAAVGNEDEQVRILLKGLMRAVRGMPPEKVHAYRTEPSFNLPAGALAVPAEAQALVERLSETRRRQEEEAFRCLGVPASLIRD